MKEMESMNIKEWALEDRPREKLYQHGAKRLTNAELLAIILSSGTKDKSALSLAKDLLNSAQENLETLAQRDISELCNIKGIGPAKAITLKAVLELANRRQHVKANKPLIKSSRDAFEELVIHLSDLKTEEFWVLFLNRANRLIAKKCISRGGVTGTFVDPKIVYKVAISHLASGLILSHNHPSGNLKPSHQDISLTRKLLEAGKNLDITVYDHLIISGNQYYSFKDEEII